jgi:predicted nucleotidyltransferase
MIAERDKTAIVEVAARYGVDRLLLFGSSADPSAEGRDIDLAVEGLPPRKFFAFYGELLFSLSKPVDLVDLSTDNAFTQMVRSEAIPVYVGTQSARQS